MEREIKLLDVVALLNAIPTEGLQAGQVGAVVEILAPDVFEVEFCDRQGRKLALLPIRRTDLLLLQYELELS